MNITRAAVDMDISHLAFEQAVGNIRAEPDKVTLYCTQACVCVAHTIKEKYGCAVMLVPNELAKNVFCWAVIGNDSMFWSLPAQ